MPAEGTTDPKPFRAAKRQYGTGSVFEKRNAWYGQWRIRNRTVTPQARADPHPG